MSSFCSVEVIYKVSRSWWLNECYTTRHKKISLYTFIRDGDLEFEGQSLGNDSFYGRKCGISSE